MMHLVAAAAAIGLLGCVASASNNATWPVQTYRTANFTPPELKITRHDSSSAGCDDGEYLFIAPGGTPSANPFVGPLIMSESGQLVWSGPELFSFNFGVQRYNGSDVLVSWNGTRFPEPAGRGNGYVYLWNHHYETIATVSLPGDFLEAVPGARYPSNVDLHEVFITERGTMLVTANNVTTTDLSSVGGPSNGWVVEAQAYEIDIATGAVLFAWKSLDHLDQLPLSASVYPLGSEGFDGRSQSRAWGYFHINAIGTLTDGFIVSSRYLSSAIALERSGRVRWVLRGFGDGKLGGNVSLGAGADFRYQHHIRVVDEQCAGPAGTCSRVTLQMHDNHNCPIDNGSVPSSGKLISIDFSAQRASLVQHFVDAHDPIFATAQGSFQRIAPSADVFVGHGYVPVLERFSPAGDIRTTYQFGNAAQRAGGGFNSSSAALTLSYRAFLQRWIGCPTRTRPSVVAEKVVGGTRVYVSWNGATEVEAWAVYGGSETLSHLATRKKTSKREFETLIDGLPDVRFVQVRALLRHDAPVACACTNGTASEVVSVT